MASVFLFDYANVISYLSPETTLEQGNVIMTGKPGEVGAVLNPPQYLARGTKMEASVGGIGAPRDEVEFGGTRPISEIVSENETGNIPWKF